MNHATILMLRTMLGVLMLGTLGAQLLTPVVASEIATAAPEVSHLVVPYSIAGILGIACAQVVLVVMWRMLGLVADDTIFSSHASHALRLVDVVVGAFAAGTLLTGIVATTMLVVPNAASPAELLATLGVGAVGVALVLLMIVMRGLLAAAARDRAELAEVV